MATAGETLIALAREVRERTLYILQNANADWLTWTPVGTANHMAWHAGHVLWAVDILCVEPLTGASELPVGWGTRFGKGSNPAADPEPWPRRDELVALLMAQWKRIEILLQSVAPAVLGSMLSDESVGWGIVHALHDEAIHQGEMSLLLKMCRARRAEG